MTLTESQVKEKIRKYAPIVQKYDSPISVAVRLAQLGLESVWFTSELAQKSNNGFGIKASAPWTGDSVEHLSGEVGGARVSLFRKYPTEEASIKDHAEFFTSTEFRQSDRAYGLAIKATNYRDEAFYLGPKFEGDTSSYAGDPKYASKLIGIIEKYNLTQYDLKKESNAKMAYIGLDIGHGANTWETGGGKGVKTGGVVYEEHTFNSIVARKLKSLLEASGHKVTYGVQQPMSNETSLRSRTNRFNAEKVDVMISIHANWIGSFKNSTNGIGAFYASYSNGSRKNNSKKLADLIMSEYRKQGQDIYGAGSIASVIGNWTNFHMTREVSMPAVLMELGFMSGTRDFDKVFGSQQDKYTTQMAQGMADGINAYFGVASKPVDTHNPQGLKETKPTAYVPPRLPFEVLKVGETATLLDDKNAKGNHIWQWYNPTTGMLLTSNKQAELAGTTDKVKDVRKIDRVQHSEYIYLLENYNSWILEEYLEEPRKDWELVSDEEPVEEDDDDVIYDGNYLKWGAKKYKIGEEIK